MATSKLRRLDLVGDVPLENLTTDEDVAHALYDTFRHAIAKRLGRDVDFVPGWDDRTNASRDAWIAVGRHTCDAITAARTQTTLSTTEDVLTQVINWLKYRRDEMRSASDPFGDTIIDGLLDEAREAYHTGSRLPASIIEEIGEEAAAIREHELILRDARRDDCCKPASEWCHRSSLEAAVAHANYRAERSWFRQYVYRSRAHESPPSARDAGEIDVIEQFWMITNWRPGRGYAGYVRPPIYKEN